MDKSKGNLRKVLNVIYFIDANKTRTFRLSFGRALALLITLALMIVWSVASIVIIAGYANHTSTQAQKIRDSLATIFEYQSRYDNVYESTYSDAVNREKPAVAEVAAEQAQQVTTPKETPAVEKENKPAIEDTSFVKTEIANKTTSDTSVVAIEEAKVSNVEGSQKLGVVFNIKNLQTPEKVEGYVWGIAKFVTESGNNIYVGTPSGIAVNSNGEVTRPKASIRYNIRYYKQTSMQFNRPANVKGDFTEIKISLMDQTDRVEEFSIPITAGEFDTGFNVPVKSKRTYTRNSSRSKQRANTAKRPRGIRYVN